MARVTTDPISDGGPRRLLGWGLAWVVAAVVAVVVGVVAVTSVGASIRGRGPLGDNDAIRTAQLNSEAGSPGTDAEPVRATIEDEFGSFVVECRGEFALGIEANPDTAAGWRTVSFEDRPDDDIDAVFANQGRSIDVEVFCNRGRPTVAEIEYNQLPEAD